MTSSGYLVVRKAGFVGERWGDRPAILTGVQNENIHYLGIDRDPWWDINGLLYGKKLSVSENDLTSRILAARIPFFCAGICNTYLCAQQALDISNRVNKLNEIIYITLNTKNDGGFEPGKNVFMGLDYYVDGCGSVLRLGLFTKPQIFTEFVSNLNGFGLFNTSEKLLEYIRTYAALCEKEGLEPIDCDALPGGVFSVYASSSD